MYLGCIFRTVIFWAYNILLMAIMITDLWQNVGVIDKTTHPKASALNPKPYEP